MPGRSQPHISIDPDLCRRCQIAEHVVVSRGQSLCGDCFCKYVSTKVVKRMELCFRVRDSTPGHQRKLLLPLSLGYGSTSLLHVLSQHLKGQTEKSGRTGYQLHVLRIQDDDDGADELRLWNELRRRLPEHAYSSCRLAAILEDEDVSALFVSALQQPQSSTSESQTEVTRRPTSIDQNLKLLGSATSRADILQILRHRLIVRFAKEHGCEAILWGHSTTRLAEKTLAETAKGRGFAMPLLIADGESPLGVPAYYPLGELLSKEIVSFASLASSAFDDLVLKETPKPIVSTKNATIDDLMRQYFATVEKEYPSIVANVVRTTGKLQTPSLDHVEKHCELCEIPLIGQAPERSRLCYGCIRTLPEAAG